MGGRRTNERTRPMRKLLAGQTCVGWKDSLNDAGKVEGGRRGRERYLSIDSMAIAQARRGFAYMSTLGFGRKPRLHGFNTKDQSVRCWPSQATLFS